MQSINWLGLVKQGRAKAMGIPWSEEELSALKNGANPDDLRAGIIKKGELKEEVKEVKEEKEEEKETLLKITPTELKKKKRDELVLLGKRFGISFDEEIVTRGDLILELEQKIKK